MAAPISIRIDDDVRLELEGQAKSRGVGLATLLRELVTQAARDHRRARIRADSEKIAQHCADSADAQAFYTDWGTPGAHG